MISNSTLRILRSSIALCSILPVTLVCTQPAYAQQEAIYRSVSSTGSAVYSSQATKNSQATHKLPQIRKIKFGQPLASTEESTCTQKGGIDCDKGSRQGEDGVFCYDGSYTLVQSFEENCTVAKLQAKLFVDFLEEPKRKLHRDVYRNLSARDSRQIKSLTVEVRNLSAVEANIDNVFIKLPFLTPRRSPLVGPSKIAAYGLELYSITFNNLPQGATPRHLAEAKFQIQCSNCKR